MILPQGRCKQGGGVCQPQYHPIESYLGKGAATKPPPYKGCLIKGAASQPPPLIKGDSIWIELHKWSVLPPILSCWVLFKQRWSFTATTHTKGCLIKVQLFSHLPYEGWLNRDQNFTKSLLFPLTSPLFESYLSKGEASQPPPLWRAA